MQTLQTAQLPMQKRKKKCGRLILRDETRHHRMRRRAAGSKRETLSSSRPRATRESVWRWPRPCSVSSFPIQKNQKIYLVIIINSQSKNCQTHNTFIFYILAPCSSFSCFNYICLLASAYKT